jgi:hypothetical protein
MDDLNPTWKRIKISMDSLCNCRPDLPLKIEVWDKDDSTDDYMGELVTSWTEFIETDKRKFDFFNVLKNKPAGRLLVLNRHV